MPYRTVRRAALSAALPLLLAAGAHAQAPADSLVGPVRPAALGAAPAPPQGEEEASDPYDTRMRIHRIGAWAVLPLFPIEYLLGERLLGDGDHANWVSSAHVGVAGALGALTVSNTVTGVWNLWDDRHERVGRTRRTVHAIGMLAADAGLVATGLAAEGAKHSDTDADLHRTLAVSSMTLMAANSLMMRFLWRE